MTTDVTKMFHCNRHSTLIQILILLTIGVVSYSNSFQVPFQFDDLGISSTNMLYSRVARLNTRYIADLTFILNHRLNGQSVTGYHVVNFVIHFITSVSVYFLVKNLMAYLIRSHPAEDSTPSNTLFIHRFIPLATATLFTCHPIQTQAVTYIVQRYTSLATMFYLLSITGYIYIRQMDSSNSSVWKRSFAIVFTISMGIFAMFSKEISFTLPFMIILIELVFFKGTILKNKVFITLILVPLIIIPAQHVLRFGVSDINDLISSIDHNTKEELTYSRMDYLITQIKVVTTYIRLLILPINQNLDYDYPLQKRFFNITVMLSLFLHIALWSTSIYMYHRSKINFKESKLTNGICQTLICLGIAWFYLTLSIESSFIPILDVIFEHRLYLPSVGGLLACTATISLATSSSMKIDRHLLAIFALISITLAVATIRRNYVWRTEISLWEDTAHKSPNKSRVLNNLATSYLEKHMTAKAVKPLLHSVELAPGTADGLNNIGMLLDQLPQYKDRYTNGMQYLIQGTTKVNMFFLNKWFANSQNNLGLLYEHLGNLTKSQEVYTFSSTLDPTNDYTLQNIIIINLKLNNLPEARKAFNRLLAVNPQKAHQLSLRSAIIN